MAAVVQGRGHRAAKPSGLDVRPVTGAGGGGGAGGWVALVPVAMFSREIEVGRVMRPFDVAVSAGSYWMTHLKSRAETPSMAAFRKWIMAEIQEGR